MSQYWIANCPGATCTSTLAKALSGATNLTADRVKYLDRSLRLLTTKFLAAVSLPITVAFKVSASAMTTQVKALYTVPAGATVFGFTAKVTEAFEGLGAATVAIGFTGTPMMSTVMASGALTLGKIVGPRAGSFYTSVANMCIPYILTTGADTLDLACAATGLSGGRLDVYLTYTPISTGILSTASSGIVLTTCT